MGRFALATSRELADLWAGDRIFLEELRRRGHAAEPVVWDDEGVDWRRWDAVVLRSCWDYHLKIDRFRAWLDALDAAGVRLLNPAPVVRWNLHKGYLLELAEAGVRIPPTRVIPRGAPGTLRAHLAEAGWIEAVVKPAVSASGHGTRLVRDEPDERDEAAFAAAVAGGDVLAQAYVPDIRTHGEWSLVFFDGRYSHAALKRAAPGEFRVHIEWGGTVERGSPPKHLVAQAQALIDRLAPRALYARVDGVEVAGELMLMELELIEPELFFDHDPQAAPRLADALLRVVRSTP